jgi:carbamoyltransferase
MKCSDIIGIQWGWNSTAALLRDGKLIACVSEERFTRKKNEMDFPLKALGWIMKEYGVTKDTISAVAIASIEGDLEYMLTRRYTDYKIKDHIREQEEYWHPKLYQNKKVSYLDLFKDKIKDDLYPKAYWRSQRRSPRPAGYSEDREAIVAEFFGIDKSKVRRIEHHSCHAAYAYYGSPFRNKPCLIFTVDAYGDGLNATISRVAGKNCWEGVERIFSTDNFQIGRIYRYMTLLLGMKPDEHEYKLMGLAPYAKQDYYFDALEVFRKTQVVEGLNFVYAEKPQDLYFHFKEHLNGHRFDNIAGAVQRYVEDCLVKWTSNAVKKFNIHRIVYSGGVAMNIKAMGKIGDLSGVKEMFVCGSGSDESLAVGAAYMACERALLKKNRNPEKFIRPIESMYLGPDTGLNSAGELVGRHKHGRFDVTKNVSAKKIARLLADGNIIARCAGRGEFGARALGNRSILAKASDPAIVPVINEQIKNRDFWMPFAPVVIEEDWKRYLVNPKSIYSPFMTVGFDTVPENRREIRAALHPADHTARPQMLKRKDNPDLWEIMHEFKKITGTGCLLNTSLNLHGYPIVNNYKDAMYVFVNSELQYLLVDKVLIHKKNNRKAAR